VEFASVFLIQFVSNEKVNSYCQQQLITKVNLPTAIENVFVNS